MGKYLEDAVKLKVPSRVQLMTSLVAVGLLIWGVGNHLNAQAQRGAGAGRGGASTFTGGTPASVDATAVRTTRLRFPKGSRSYWHTHSWGQLLMIEEGKGRTQVRGGPVLEMLPGQPWWTAAGIEHWHGAAPDQDALQLTIYEGTVNWLEAVSDKDYNTTPKK
jgi:quercetin dioxygenase-like cupin family protein